MFTMKLPWSKDYRSTLNGKIRDEIIAWCKTWDADRCQKCGQEFSELERQSQIIEEQTGQKRILPVYVADHRDGNESHIDGYIDVDHEKKPIEKHSNISPRKQIWHKFGNMRRLCWSCNRIEGIIKRKTLGSERHTREKQDRVSNEGLFIFETENQINERGDVCYLGMCKAGVNVCDSSEVTCRRYLDSQIRTPENPNGKFHLFPWTCGGKFCNGNHVSWANIKPEKVLEKEREIYEREWSMQYPDLQSDDAVRKWEHSVGFDRKWVSKEHYVSERLKLTWD